MNALRLNHGSAAILVVVSLAWETTVLAQQSASFKLEEHSFSEGGHPQAGTTLASTSFRIRLDSIGGTLAEQLAMSSSFHMAAGFINAYPPPGAVLGLRFTDDINLAWNTEKSIGSYAVYRALTTTLPALGYGGCLDSGLATESYADVGVPPANRTFFYLVTARNLLGEEGTKGYASSGAERPNPAPCP